MKQLFDEKKAAKKRQFHWCRRPNSFSDQPIFRLVATKCNMPLYQVLAFVNRLEEHANNAANHKLIRGSLALFDPDEFAVALGMTGEETARLYAVLEDPRIAWIVDDHIATFIDRNPDRDEDVDDARIRKRRQRSRERVLKQLAKLARLGRIEAAERLTIEVALRGISDQQLQHVQDQLARAELSTCHNVTARDIVTVTPEQSRFLEKDAAAVDNSGDVARGDSGGLARVEGGEGAKDGEDATRWVDQEGKKLIVERLTIPTTLADMYVERWRRDLQDDVELKAIITGVASREKLTTAQFHTLISSAVARKVDERERGRPLGLMPPKPGSQPKGPETATGHVVTPGLVDKLKRSAS